MANAYTLELFEISNNSLALLCNYYMYGNKTEGRSRCIVCKTKGCYSSISLRAEDGELVFPLILYGSGSISSSTMMFEHSADCKPKDNAFWIVNTFLLAVQHEIDVNPLVPIQKLYEIERGKAHTHNQTRCCPITPMFQVH